ncbi:MAG: FdtA/QdtA family cupin domain-containing protein, partial [Muribaculaceae bacterium]|nr:FdtA/QdtA family cupin domain-containing protein [Muribaculaceae bacterium]
MPRISDNRGSLTFLQFPLTAPFEIKRIFYLYDMPEGAQRGGHAHIRESQMLVALAGSFDVKVFDGENWETFTLDSPDIG